MKYVAENHKLCQLGYNRIYSYGFLNNNKVSWFWIISSICRLEGDMLSSIKYNEINFCPESYHSVRPHITHKILTYIRNSIEKLTKCILLKQAERNLGNFWIII